MIMTHNLVNYGTIKELSGIGVSEPFEILFCLYSKSFMYYWDYPHNAMGQKPP
jgi:hypothetical protein